VRMHYRADLTWGAMVTLVNFLQVLGVTRT